MPAILLHHYLERAADEFGDRDAVWAGDERWSFRRLDDLSSSFAEHLVAQGIGHGDRVALMLSNRPGIRRGRLRDQQDRRRLGAPQPVVEGT